MKGTSDRAAGILAAAHLEVQIEGLLRDRFVSMGESDANLLFGPQGILSAAMAKVRLAHAMGLFGTHTKEACATIFDIRNTLAHAPRSVDFSTNAIKNKCDGLNVVRIYKEHGLNVVGELIISNAREKYISSVYSIYLEIARTQARSVLEKLDKLRDGVRPLIEQSKEETIDREKLRANLAKMEASLADTKKPLLP